MKKIFLYALFLCCSIACVQAQGKQSLGLQVGFTQPITRLNSPVPGKETTLNPTTYNGLKVGVIYDATIVAGFGYALGLNYTFGANRTDWNQIGNLTYPRKYSQGLYHQVEIPVDWQYKFEIAKDTWLMLYTGPTLQCGLSFSNKWNTQNEPNGEIITTIDDRYDAEGAYALKRLNVTWGLGAGFQYERYFLRGGYDFGIINPYQSQVFSVSETYNPYTRGRFDQWQIKLGIYLWSR